MTLFHRHAERRHSVSDRVYICCPPGVEQNRYHFCVAVFRRHMKRCLVKRKGLPYNGMPLTRQLSDEIDIVLYNGPSDLAQVIPASFIFRHLELRHDRWSDDNRRANRTAAWRSNRGRLALRVPERIPWPPGVERWMSGRRRAFARMNRQRRRA